jgi:hypothetical protein
MRADLQCFQCGKRFADPIAWLACEFSHKQAIFIGKGDKKKGLSPLMQGELHRWLSRLNRELLVASGR